jgi:hypothetical protein
MVMQMVDEWENSQLNGKHSKRWNAYNSRGFGVLKIKFLALSHPINLHHRDAIYYLILSTIFCIT